MEVCGIVLEIQGSSQALGVIWERCGIVRECWAGDKCQGQTRERTDFSTLPHPLAPSPALISASWLNPRVSHGGSPNSVPTTWQMGSLPRNPDTSLGPLLRVIRGRDVVGVPRHPCLPQRDQSLREQPQFPRLLEFLMWRRLMPGVPHPLSPGCLLKTPKVRRIVRPCMIYVVKIKIKP